MKAKAVLLILVVLCLLLAVAITVYAGKPGPGKDKEKGPPAWAQDKPKKDKGESPSQGSQKMVTICHKPGTAAEKTLEVPESAVPGHLQHGDYEGACSELEPAPVPTDTVPISATATVTICHKPGTPAEKTLVLPEAAVPGHLRHGDELGACPEVTPTLVPTDTFPISATAPITICHKPGTPAEKTLVLPQAAVPGHLQHGDELGPCPDWTSPPAPADGLAVASATNRQRGPNRR
jgi:hypothetical protein